ncbi:MAG: hypothetical protein L6Q38_19305, partial [Nitrospira sp.]|nr:hypothetical protein [Nitrospira sp.]
ADIIALEEAEKVPATGAKRQSNGKKATADNDSSLEPDTAKWLEREWLKRWLSIEPALGETDLRPYVFVARDKRLLMSVTGPGGLEGLVTKLCGAQLELRACEPEVKALTPGDAGIVFSALRERVLSAGTFKNPVAGIDGLSIIAKHHPTFQGEVVKLLGSLVPKELGLWVLKGWNESITETKARDELRGVIQGWANQDDNRLLKQAAPSALAALQTGRG